MSGERRGRGAEVARVRRAARAGAAMRGDRGGTPRRAHGGSPVAAGDYGAATPAAAGPGRLVSTRADLRGLLGVELLPAVVVGCFAVALGWRAARLPRAGALFVAVWLLTGVAVLSFMPDLKVRYVDVLAPPAAIALGRRDRLADPAKAGRGACCSPRCWRRPPRKPSGWCGTTRRTPGTSARSRRPRRRSLSAFLARHHRTRYELASATAAKAAPLIERDDRPILMLGTQLGHELTGLKTLRKDVRNDEVRYVLIAGRCGPHTWRTGCGRAARWAEVDGRDVSHASAAARRNAVRAHPRLSARRYPQHTRCTKARSRSSSSTTSRRCAKRSPGRSREKDTPRSPSLTGGRRSTAPPRTASTWSLLDAALGAGPDGYEVCRTLRDRHNTVPIIMLTALDSRGRHGARARGRRGRLRRQAGRSGGAAAAASAPSSDAPARAPHDVLKAGPLTLDRGARELRKHDAPVSLTFSEFEVIAALMAAPGRLLNRQELMRAIWGDSAFRDPRGIDVHVRHLREKLEQAPDKPELILTVRGAGYRLAA